MSSTPSTFGAACSEFIGTVLGHLVPTVSADTSAPSSEEEKVEEAEEEEEDEPEDPSPAIRDECAETKCSKYKHHFDHCQERVQGKAEKGEDCVEELFHLMHCVDGCAVPKVFSKLV
ncbi:hypothetical protein CROQUDRAFT_674603 [Cronartium quercuum f. sp. fusiforme G11]|uniref:Ubiquinol-cytochrome C reductase hinge domain-containing protein n=1 Tax=Cronartium quercuum f. sp. fusiforme G11 TaxID=708437 RepID=A0A9P6N7P7_9BASI|nr:hypothetical protein CROQUDRAFT_674603 [Cronartium quercuum f. sp. fusiforme G11]